MVSVKALDIDPGTLSPKIWLTQVISDQTIFENVILFIYFLNVPNRYLSRGCKNK